MFTYFDKKVIVLAVCVLLIMFISCEKYLPDPYQPETFSTSEQDNRAYNYLTRPLYPIDTLYVTDRGDTVTVVTETDSVVEIIEDFDTLFTSITTSIVPESLITSSNFDSLAALMDTLVRDTTLVIENPEYSDTNYVSYYHDGSGGDTYFYISWDFTEDNLDEYIDIDLIRRDAEIVKKNAIVDLESISGCSERVTIPEAGIDELIPKIRTRCGFALEEGPYLVRFIISEPAEVGSFRTVILHE